MAEKAAPRGEIFVVDDDPAVRDTLSIVLSAAGHQVVCFADGAALLAVARGRQVNKPGWARARRTKLAAAGKKSHRSKGRRALPHKPGRRARTRSRR